MPALGSESAVKLDPPTLYDNSKHNDMHQATFGYIVILSRSHLCITDGYVDYSYVLRLRVVEPFKG